MAETSLTLLFIGLLFVIGMTAELVGRRTRIPRVTLLIMAGVALGPSVFGLVDPYGTEWFEVVSQVALTMVGFLLGSHLSRDALRRHGKDVLVVSLCVVGVSAALVFLGTWLASGAVALALLLAGAATATDPAATSDVVNENQAEGPFSETLLGVVAIDDAWGIALFSICLAAAAVVGGSGGAEALLTGAWEIGGAVLLGLALGVPVAWASGRIAPGEPTLVEALAVVFLCLGAARWLDVSFLLASVVLGVVVANLARHHERPFAEIEHIRWPFMIVFFLLAGAALNVRSLTSVGLVGVAYVVMRVIGRGLGGAMGGRIRGFSPRATWWMGPALMPQAGVAIGMALVAGQRFPGQADTLLAVVLASTVLFELIGPLMTQQALVRVGETKRS